MLQRAASNAYSWWWASHIRTKQSKWLDQSLQDMEENVQSIIKLIEEDGDSFARRAEMYYKKRPELINFVQEAYRAFRALADRYDHLSKELQNANNQLATVFPEQFQMEIDDDDDLTTPKPPRKFPQVPVMNESNLPSAPKAPKKDWKGVVSASKQLQQQPKNPDKTPVQKSGLTKNEALEEIDKLQKEILSLQTVKEFVKSSYQNGLSKYKGIETEISEKQQRLSSLQNEFGLNKVIEDDEARTLMAEAALNSCEETLAQLKEKQENFHEEAKEEFKRIQDARQKLESIRKEFLHDQTVDAKEESKSSIKPQENSIEEILGNTTVKIEENIDEEGGSSSSSGSLTVTQLAEKIDKLVNKVINLETAVSTQTVLIVRLRTEANDLNSQIHVLIEDKANLTDDTQNLKIRVQKMEEKLDGIHVLNRDVENQNNNLQTHFAEARSSLDHLSEKLNNVKPDEEDEIPLKIIKQNKENPQQNPKCNGQKDTVETNNAEEIKEEDPGTPAKAKKDSKNTVKTHDPTTKDDENGGSCIKIDPQTTNSETETEDGFDWKKMLLSGVEDKEKLLLKEYTMILRNYKEAKKKIIDMEKKEKDQGFEVTIQMRELKSALAKRDEEIQRLRQKLSDLQGNVEGEETEEKTDLCSPSIHKEDDEIKLIFLDQPNKSISHVDEKLRHEIDAILDENLDFWLRFSGSYHQIEKFKTSVQDLQYEITKLTEKKKQGVCNLDLRSDARPLYKHLKEIQTELTVWTDQSGLLKTELENRFSSLCSIQQKITNALKEGVEEDEIRFSSHHAAKFQGEILNMKQENNKVREELQTGVDHITTLRFEIDKTLEKLSEEFELSGDQNSGNRPRVPLRSFIFGTKQKKQRNSIFSYMHTNRKYQTLRSGAQ